MTSPSSTTPALSAIVVTSDDYATVRRLVQHLAAQTARGQLEIIIVGPRRDAIEPIRGDTDGVASVQLIEVGPVTLRGSASADGVKAARAPIVALTEDHSFPEPDWAARVIAAHQEPCAGVGIQMKNANPHSATSAAMHVITYARWNEPVARGEMDDLPGFNSSYKRDALLAFGASLPQMLNQPGLLHETLRGDGQRLLIEPDARTNHWTPSHFRDAAWVCLIAGRLYGTARAREAHWGAAKRAAYVLGLPLIPIMRWRPLAARSRELPREARPAGFWTALAVLVIATSIGEAMGYVFGEGTALVEMSLFEYHRERLLRAVDRRAFLS